MSNDKNGTCRLGYGSVLFSPDSLERQHTCNARVQQETVRKTAASTPSMQELETGCWSGCNRLWLDCFCLFQKGAIGHSEYMALDSRLVELM